jgi:hypothetical protein
MGHAGLLPELNVGLGMGWSASEVDFWSYAGGLGEEIRNDRPNTIDDKNGKQEEWKLKGTDGNEDG